MNEPILPGPGETATDWLAGEFAGKYFVQRIALDLAGRSRTDVAKAWVYTLSAAIRRHDARHLITVGVIPWAMVFPGAKPIFYDPDVGKPLDLVCIHVYPKTNELPRAVDAVKTFDLGKPLIIEEIFPLHCTTDDLAQFLQHTRPLTTGLIGFYWGVTPAEYHQRADIPSAIIAAWLDFFQSHQPTNPQLPDIP